MNRKYSLLPGRALEKGQPKQKGQLLFSLAQTGVNKFFCAVKGRVSNNIIDNSIFGSKIYSGFAIAPVVQVRRYYFISGLL
ncbi:hypothetical protein A3722_20545 [Sulfitobacter sp. HI0027]|nr:hypothetical protein A3722_20545 [Sulfitobacter sp. HI0027]